MLNNQFPAQTLWRDPEKACLMASFDLSICRSLKNIWNRGDIMSSLCNAFHYCVTYINVMWLQWSILCNVIVSHNIVYYCFSETAQLSQRSLGYLNNISCTVSNPVFYQSHSWSFQSAGLLPHDAWNWGLHVPSEIYLQRWKLLCSSLFKCIPMSPGYFCLCL